VGVGTTYRQVRSEPRISEEEFEVTAFDPPRRLLIDGEIGPFRGQIGYTLEVTDTGTRLTNWMELEPSSILSRILAPLAASQIEAAVASNLDRLKRVLEDARHAM
jgi:hypothetical protein